MTLFDSLYRSFEQSDHSTGPRPTARPKPRGTAARTPGRGRKER
jgi:hypothetical protein